MTAARHGRIEYRVYRWCSEDPTPPCDDLQGNRIIDGGLITFDLTSAFPAGTAVVAEGQVTSSTDTNVSLGRVTARVKGYIVGLSIFAGELFCSLQIPASQSDACGA